MLATTWGLLLLSAAVATLLAPDARPASASRADAPLGAAAASPAQQPATPLTGTWQTIANGDRVVEVLRDGDTIWAASEGGGLLRWSSTQEGFTQWLSPQNGLPSNDVRDLAFAPDGRLWLATAAGLARFDPRAAEGKGAVTMVLDPERSPGMPARSTTAVLVDDGALWVGFEQAWDPARAHPLEARGAPPGAFAPGGLARYELGDEAWTDHWPAVVRDPPPGDPDPELRFESLPSDNVTDIGLATDGTLWVATRPYYLWDTSACNDGPCLGDASYWLFAGGGLAATRGGQWRDWRPTLDADTSCYDEHVNALEPGAEGRMWAGTFGRGLLMMSGFEQSLGCASGQAYYVDTRDPDQPGLRGNVVRAVSREAGGVLWLAQGQGAEDGLGLARFDPKGTFEDSSASPAPWDSDDVWAHFDVDHPLGEAAGPVDLIIDALDAMRPDDIVVGTIDERLGDGHGLRLLRPDPLRWRALRSADAGLPSNHVTGVAHDDDADVTWFATERRGLARLDHATGQWRHERSFVEAGMVASITRNSSVGMSRVAVDFADESAFAAALPGARPWVRVGEDPTWYRVEGFVPERSGLGPFLDLAPPLQRDAPADSALIRIDRGPAGDRGSQIALRADGQPWAGAFKGRFQAAGLDGRCEPLVDCWLEGGIGGLDAAGDAAAPGLWQIHQPADSPLGQFDVSSVAIDLAGRVWLGISDLIASGAGMAVLDPETGAWETHQISVDMPAGNGVSDLAVDPSTGHVWSAHVPVERRVMRPGQPDEIVNAGGGISRYDGERWRSWTKRDSGSRLVGAGDWGVFYAVTADRVNGRIWAGGWDGSPRTVHWPTGTGADAVVNWCPIDTCEPGDWQHVRWDEEGLVSTLATDGAGRLWAGTHRFGRGKIPAPGGVKLWEGEAWHEVVPAHSGLPENQISTLAADASGMWVGTRTRGVVRYVDMPASPPSPSPTPPVEPTPTGPATSTPGGPSATPTASPSPSPTATEGPDATATPVATTSASPTDAARPTPTRTATVAPTRMPSPVTPQPCEGPESTCRALLPALFKAR